MNNNKNLEITFYINPINKFDLTQFQKEYPEFSNIKILENNNIFNNIIECFGTIQTLCRKNSNDNLFKKICRFLIIRIIKILNLNEFEYILTTKELEKFNTFFSPCYKIPGIIAKNKNIINFTMLHDITPLVVPEYNQIITAKNSWFKKLFKSLNPNDYYFANSEYTKQDFINHCKNINPNHITTALLGASENFCPIITKEKWIRIKEKYNIPKDKKFVFSLCTIEPRKNLIFAIKNFIKFIKKNNIEDLIFVLGGGHWQSFSDKFNKEIETIGDYKSKIIFTDYIADEDLATLYNASEIFVYTSLYEGFGIPILEAMQCGCACITSNVTSIPEVIGDAGIQINPKSDEEMIDAYKKMYYDADFKNQCKQKALERAKQFSWQKCGNIITERIIEVVRKETKN